MMGESGYLRKKGDNRPPNQIPRRRTRLLSLKNGYPAFGNLVPRDVASRAAKERVMKGMV